ncbi:peptide/nickel transport system substrate-binding protein [Saccharothrix tamanrassetensis]|uniref:Peptide/nickel transport system substrate-binding protein n=1 Tax=Saccharothrix tamanrassetensis TaxID=1051531 RepID=A0A841CC51_9PSEU|nr:ABC transporter substrate-binding protein [Saccharothrix tamanrassetensis]MBB5953757.1 peptide/nickel transport system substrate-binding protein [Saccharothrix tamanrassetensis]
MFRLGLLAGVTAVGAPVLSSCGGGGTSTGAGQSGGAGKPLATLKVGAPHQVTDSEPGNPLTSSIGATLLVLRHVYDSLMVLDNGEYRYQLAESVEPNADATAWTIRLREGVTFHDGKPLKAADVVHSLRTVGSKPSNRASVYGVVDLANMSAVDDRTVKVPLLVPRGDFKESVLVVFSPVFPDGLAQFAKPIGSGPYKMVGRNGTTTTLVANEQYWGGKPTVGELQVVGILDAAARLSALKAGQVDYAISVSATGAKTEAGSADIEIRRGGAANSNALSFAMNQQLAPFDNPKVRKAVRLAVDRQALVDNALLGLGSPADDVVGKTLPGYADLPARGRDLDQARRLFAEAGVTKLTLRTGEIVPGMLNASKLLAQQLAEAGVELTLQESAPDAYYADLTTLTKHPFQAFYYVNRPASVHLAAVTNAKAPFNVTGPPAGYQTRLAAAQAMADDKAREQAFRALQKEFYDEGGDVVWGFQEQLDAARKGIGGVRVVQSVQLFDQATGPA